VRELSVELPDAEIAERLRAWKPPQPRYRTGAFAKYAATVTSASEGAVTRPAGAATSAPAPVSA